eukprot:CAMPEP_0184971550 /NCGR_PEP_ID=MMETSP1098-20130426/3765_1 /TAXON_ID=89044 /ORGANISM="Spumella elongata, Strain CCAP 955/1" /LENGTH=732 /DNA_ID=CAMNT_0027493697 /DNA_START=159 /DNA_END=2357 /DNA_ORIENTATION=-
MSTSGRPPPRGPPPRGPPKAGEGAPSSAPRGPPPGGPPSGPPGGPPKVHHQEAHHQAHPEPPPEVHPAEQALLHEALHPEARPQQLPVQVPPWAPHLAPLPAVLVQAQLVAAVPPEVHQAAQAQSAVADHLEVHPEAPLEQDPEDPPVDPHAVPLVAHLEARLVLVLLEVLQEVHPVQVPEAHQEVRLEVPPVVPLEVLLVLGVPPEAHLVALPAVPPVQWYLVAVPPEVLLEGHREVPPVQVLQVLDRPAEGCLLVAPVLAALLVGPEPPPPGGEKPLQLVAPPSAPVAPKFGRLVVKCLRGVDLKAGQGMFGKADPYSKLRIGTQEYSTKPNPGGGKNPIWNEEFTFDISNEKEMEIEVLDKETVGNDKFMGRCKVSIIEWIANGRFEGDLDLQDKMNKPVGRVSIACRFERPNAAPGGSNALVVAGEGAGYAAPGGPVVLPNANMADSVRDPAGKFTDDEILEAFKAFDLDKNNFVGAAEIRHVLINIGEQVTDEEVDEMIRMVDSDGDGQVSWDEFYSMVTGGKKAPAGLGIEAKGGAAAAKSGAPPPPTGQNVVQARNAKKAALEEFAKENNLKPESIKKAYKRFQATDKDKSGVVDYTEFCEILQVDPAPLCETVFRLYDYDKTGQIDAREFLIAVSNYTGAGKEDKLKFAFMSFDEDGNGVITKAELLKILKSNHMASHDAEVARKADTIMAQADKDGDGVITFDEFVIVSKKFPNILFPAYQTK